MINRLAGGLAALCVVCAPAMGQDDEALEYTRQQLSHAAGYKAAFTCSAHFNAGRTVDQINAHELSRIYPDFRGPMATLPAAVIDEEAKTVSVTWIDDFPPRIAQWRPYLGCFQLPPGASVGDVTPPDPGFTPPEEEIPFFPQSDMVGSLERAVILTAFDGNTYGEGALTSAVVVVKDKELVFEHYADGFGPEVSQRTWSVAKSIAATVIGAALPRTEGLILDSDQAAYSVWSTFDGDPRLAVTLRHLLHMSSGLNSDPTGSRTDEIYFGGGRVYDQSHAAELEAAPGKRWRYANNDTLLAVHRLSVAPVSGYGLGSTAEDAYKAHVSERILGVLARIGMHDTVPETDWVGDFVLSSQVWTTARDLARLGVLYANDGVEPMTGERIFPDDWLEFVSTPAPAHQRGDDPDDWGYGGHWWLLGGVAGLPDDTIAAAGHRGQYVVVIPSEDLVIVRRGYDESGGVQFNIGQFAADVREALEG